METQTEVLQRGSELRFEASLKHPVTVKLVKGRAEMFGTELVLGKTYKFTDTSFAIFTWHGCTLQYTSESSNAYVSGADLRETPMRHLLNLHAALEKERQIAFDDNADGPRVMVVGPSFSGKSTVCRIITNYACRMFRMPVLVDVDPNDNVFSMPCVIGAAPITQPADAVGSFSDAAPVTFHFGHTSVKTNPKYFKFILHFLSLAVNEKLSKDAKARVGGLIINCPVCPTEILLELQSAFKCTVICVIDHERLVNELPKHFSKANIENVRVIKLPKSGGVLPVEHDAKQFRYRQLIRRYFYGTPFYRPLMPHTITLPFSLLRIFKIGAPEVPLDCLPIGASRPEVELELLPVSKYQPDLLHRVCSVVNCGKTALSAEIKSSSLVGFVVIEAHDHERETLKLLSPAPDRLPSIVLLMHETSFVDSS
eukprot:gene1813-4913_t